MNTFSKHSIGFFISIQVFAWLGLYLKQVKNIEGAELLFLCTPLLLALALNAKHPNINFLKSLRQVNLKSAWRWYLFALSIYPISYALISSIGAFTGLVSLGNWQAYPLLILAAAPSAFIFATFEELTWRGYLEPKLLAEGKSAFQASLITGVIWALWHAPLFAFAYYEIYSYAPVWSFIMFSITLVISSQVYGLMRRRSKTVWTSVIMHSTANAFAFPIIMGDSALWTNYSQAWLILITPSSLLSLLFWLTTGIILFRLNKKTQTSQKIQTQLTEARV